MGLGDFLRENPGVRYIMFGGKGGLGKTSFSAATAYYLSKKGYKVLLFSVDPQASLSDIFQMDLFGKGEIEIIPNLFACEVDADRRIKEQQEEVRRKIKEMYGMEKIPEEIEDYIRAASAEPAMEESAIFDQVVDLVIKGDYDYYIYDLVPLGHALYYLSMASVYDAWIDKIMKLREEMREYEKVAAVVKRERELQEDQILRELLLIRDRIGTSSKILTDPEKTAFFFVLTPEEMVILDTIRAADLFRKHRVPIRGYILNRILPYDLLSKDIPSYLRNRIEMQRAHLERIEEMFGDKILGRVPEFERDIVGLDMVARTAKFLFGEEDI